LKEKYKTMMFILLHYHSSWESNCVVIVLYEDQITHQATSSVTYLLSFRSLMSTSLAIRVLTVYDTNLNLTHL